MENQEKVIEIVCDLLGADAEGVTADTDLREDLQADSLDFTEIVMELEDTFDFESNEEDIVNIKTVGDIVKYIESVK